MIDVGFIFPSNDYVKNPFRFDPHTHFQILSVLENCSGSRVNPKLIDLRGIGKEFARYHIPECDVYLYSLFTLDYKEQKTIHDELKEIYPKSKHIAGGPHVSCFKEDVLKSFDSVVLGDGENSIIQAIDDASAGSLKKVYEQNSPIDINEYSFPRRHFLPPSTVGRRNIMKLRNKEGYENLLGTSVIFSRGCPYNCSFCAMPQIRKYNAGVRYREPRLVTEEILYLKEEYGIEGLLLLDEIGIPLAKKQAIAHLKAIGEGGVVWRGQCRVDGITPELARLAYESNCVAMGLGAESASQRALDMANKKIGVEKSKETIKILKQNGIETKIYMIIGMPGEPEDIVEKTWKFIEETKPEQVYLSLFTARPGTDVYENPGKYGIEYITSDWDKLNHMFGRQEQVDYIPELSFRYAKRTPWGEGQSSDKIVSNYVTLRERIAENGMAPL